MALEWTEINPAAPRVFRLGRRTLGRSNPGDQTAGRGSAGAAAIGALFTFLNNDALNHAIERTLAHLRGAEVVMTNHRFGGVLAEAHIIVRYEPSAVLGPAPPGLPPSNYYGSYVRKLAGVYVAAGAERCYAQPGHALSVRNSVGRQAPLLAAGTQRNEFSEYRFFWGHRS